MKTTPPIRHLFSLAATIMAGASLHAAPVIYEPFSQTAGSISGKAGGTGLNNWAVVSTASTVATTPTLAYGQLANNGGQLSLPNGGGQTAYVTRTSALSDAGLLADGATLWFSFVYSKAAGGGSNERSGFAFGTDHLRTNSTSGAFMDNSGNGLGIYTQNNGIVTITWNGGGAGVTGAGTSFPTYGETVTVVGKVVWGATAGNVETLTIWSPSETSLPLNEAGLGTGFSKTMTGVDQTAFDTISMQQRNSGGVIIYDEIRFGAALADVIPLDAVPPTLLSITDDQGGGPIREDITAVTYTLTFDRHMDIATITDADFQNVGSATATVGTVTQLSPTVIAVQLLPTTTGTLQLRIPSSSVLASLAGVDLDTTSDIDDAEIITINAGSTPDTGNRYWDGNITAGITNGVSAGGNGTWNTTNTNWDAGAGFADPVAWDNTHLDTAILGGSAGTITLGSDVTAGGITSSATYTISGANTLTMDVASGTPVINVTSGQLTISSKISGNKGLQKDGGGTLRLGNNSNDFTGGFTLNGGQVVINASGTYTGFGSGTLTINSGKIGLPNPGGAFSFTTTNDSVWNGSFTVYRGQTGGATWNHGGDITLGANVTVSSDNNFWTTIVNGAIGETGGARGLTLAGTGLNFTLNGDNTYTGATVISSDDLTIGGSGRLGGGNYAGNITVTAAGNAFIYSSSSDQLLSGNITGSGTVTKDTSASSVLTLSGTNSYAGVTSVTAGKFFMNGTLSNANVAFTVASGATLGGNGNIGRNVTIADGGKLEFNLSTDAASHDKLDLAASRTFTFSGASTLTITSSGSPTTGDFILVTAPGGFGVSAAPGTVVLPLGWTADPPRFDGNDLKINITSIGSDAIPPVWTSGWPKADTTGTTASTAFNVRAQTDEAGSAYYVVLASGAAAPSSAQVMAGTDSTDSPALKSGNLALTANTEASGSVTGLSSGITYDVWFVAQDAVSNLQAAPSKVSVTTLTNYQAWLAANSRTDSDANRKEYAFGTSNTGALVLDGAGTAIVTRGQAPIITTTVGSEFVKLSYARRKNSGFTFSAEYSDGLVTWLPSNDPTLIYNPSAPAGETVVDNGDEMEIVSLNFPVFRDTGSGYVKIEANFCRIAATLN